MRISEHGLSFKGIKTFEKWPSLVKASVESKNKIDSKHDRRLEFRRGIVVIWCRDVHAAQSTAMLQPVGWRTEDYTS